MTLLFLDGFDHYTTVAQKYELTPGSGASITAGAARTGTGGFVAGNTGASPISKIVPASAEHATFIAGIAVRRVSGLSGNGCYLSFLSDGGATQHISLGADTAGKLYVKRGAYNGTTLGTEAGNTLGVVSVWHYVELKVLLSDTVGTVEVRVDGSATPVIALTGQDTKNGGTKTVFDSAGISGEASVASINIDDFYICNAAGSINNDFLGDIRIDTLYPNADGSNSALGPSTGTTHATLVDESPPNTSDYVAGSTNDTVDTWNYANTTVVGTVRGIQLNTFAQKSDSNPKSFRPVVRHSGSDYPGTDQALGIGFGYYRQLYETNPGTAAAWTTAQLDAAEFGAAVRP